MTSGKLGNSWSLSKCLLLLCVVSFASVCLVILSGHLKLEHNDHRFAVVVVTSRWAENIAENGKPHFKSTQAANGESDVKLPFQTQSLVEWECFQSPFIICNSSDLEERWRKADEWRNREMDSLSSKIYPGRPRLESKRAIPTNASNKVIRIASLYRANYISAKSFDFSICHTHRNCEYLGNNVNTTNADVIVVSGPKIDLHRKQIRSRSDQLFVMMGWESPIYFGPLGKSRSSWDTVFNLTISYRLDSDIFSPYGVFVHSPKPSQQRPDYVALSQRKEKMVAWMVSHCKTDSMRMKYVRELRKYIQVDIYGKCGSKCPAKPDYCGKDFGHYRYYLSFENSICTDYVTEKFFKPLQHGVIPVVRGGLDYKKYFPPYSFINTADFSSPKSLAEFLKHLSRNATLYSRYLEVLDQYRYVFKLSHFPCGLCRAINRMDQTQSKYYNILDRLSVKQCSYRKDYA